MNYNGKEIKDMNEIECLAAIAEISEKLGKEEAAECAARMAEGIQLGMSEDEVIRYSLGVDPTWFKPKKTKSYIEMFEEELAKTMALVFLMQAKKVKIKGRDFADGIGELLEKAMGEPGKAVFDETLVNLDIIMTDLKNEAEKHGK